MISTDYTVSGMTCEHCVAAITEEVSRVGGVDEVDLDLPTGRMTVRSHTPLTHDVIAAAVDEAGAYSVHAR